MRSSPARGLRLVLLAAALGLGASPSAAVPNAPACEARPPPAAGRQGEWVMAQLRGLRSQRQEERTGERDGDVGGAGFTEENFQLAQGMLLEELRTDDECPICMEYNDSHAQNAAVLDGCGHCLCVGCAAKWAKSSATLDEAVASPSAVGERHACCNAFQCPLCNQVTHHLFIQLEQNGRYMPTGRWRRVNVAQLLLSYSCADLAEKDSGWSIVGETRPTELLGFAYTTQVHRSEEDDDVARTSWTGMDAFSRDASTDEDGGEGGELDDGLWEARCMDLEENLLHRQVGRRSRHGQACRQPIVEAVRRHRKVRGGTSRVVRSVVKGIRQESPAKVDRTRDRESLEATRGSRISLVRDISSIPREREREGDGE